MYHIYIYDSKSRNSTFVARCNLAGWLMKLLTAIHASFDAWRETCLPMPTAQKEVTTSIQKSVACGIYSPRWCGGDGGGANRCHLRLKPRPNCFMLRRVNFLQSRSEWLQVTQFHFCGQMQSCRLVNETSHSDTCIIWRMKGNMPPNANSSKRGHNKHSKERGMWHLLPYPQSDLVRWLWKMSAKWATSWKGYGCAIKVMKRPSGANPFNGICRLPEWLHFWKVPWHCLQTLLRSTKAAKSVVGFFHASPNWQKCKTFAVISPEACKTCKMGVCQQREVSGFSNTTGMRRRRHAHKILMLNQ